MQLDRVLDDYTRYLSAERGFSENTVRSYRSDLVDLLRYAEEMGATTAKEVDLELLRGWLYRASTAGLAKSTLARRSATARGLTSWLARTGDTPTDAAEAGVGEDGLPSGSLLLVVKRGPNAGSRFRLDQPVTSAGRHPDSDIFLDDISVSRRHGTFTRSDAGYSVADLGSLNGTYVNRDRIDSEVALSGGDEVQIGKYRLIYFAGALKG